MRDNRRIRILNLVQTVPFPPRCGADLRAWHLAKAMAATSDYTLLCRALDHVPPGTDESFRAAGIRLQALRLPRPRPPEQILKAANAWVRGYPLMAAGWSFRPLQACLRNAVLRDGFDVVMADTSWLCTYWPILRRSHATRILHLYDVLTDMLRKQAALEPFGWRRLVYLYDAARMRHAEQHMASESDLVIVPSDQERLNLLQHAPRANIVVIPNGVDSSALKPLPPSETAELLYVGSMSYSPNADAVAFFANEVLPILKRQMSHVVFRVVGRCPPEHITRLRAIPGVHIEGEVDDVTPYYQRAAACVVPLRFGGGTRLKILEAFALGRPVVSTALGAEGLAVLHGKHLLKADSPQDFADAITLVLRDSHMRKRLTTEGRALAESTYAWPAIAQTLLREINSAVTERRQPKETNNAHLIQPRRRFAH